MSIKTRVGKIVTVKNQNKKSTANKSYQAVILNKDGHYSSYLFTDIEIAVATERAKKNIEDTLEQSLLSRIID